MLYTVQWIWHLFQHTISGTIVLLCIFKSLSVSYVFTNCQSVLESISVICIYELTICARVYQCHMYLRIANMCQSLSVSYIFTNCQCVLESISVICIYVLPIVLEYISVICIYELPICARVYQCHMYLRIANVCQSLSVSYVFTNCQCVLE